MILENWAALTRIRSGPSLTRGASKGVQTSATIERGALVLRTPTARKNTAPAVPTRAATATLGKRQVASGPTPIGLAASRKVMFSNYISKEGFGCSDLRKSVLGSKQHKQNN